MTEFSGVGMSDPTAMTGERDAHRCGAQRGRVVRAIANHEDGVALLHERVDDGNLALGQEITLHLVDASRRRD